LVRDRFVYLSEQGFVAEEILPTDLRFRRDDVEITIYWDPRSFEIDLAIGKGPERYSMSEILRATDPDAAEKYRSWSAGTPDSLVSGVTALANLFALYGKSAIAGGESYFSELKRKRREWSIAYSAEVMAAGVRREADEAFRSGSYREAAALYRQFEAALTPSEKGKLEFALRKAREEGSGMSDGQ
jgi:hypothetical protein